MVEFGRIVIVIVKLIVKPYKNQLTKTMFLCGIDNFTNCVCVLSISLVFVFFSNTPPSPLNWILFRVDFSLESLFHFLEIGRLLSFFTLQPDVNGFSHFSLLRFRSVMFMWQCIKCDHYFSVEWHRFISTLTISLQLSVLQIYLSLNVSNQFMFLIAGKLHGDTYIHEWKKL